MTTDEKIEHFKDYLRYRIDIISNDIDRWLLKNSKYQLPTFEYYLQNCVIDKGGNYDFTIRRYGNQKDVKEMNVKNQCIDKSLKVSYGVNYSMWMGTPFNYENNVIY